MGRWVGGWLYFIGMDVVDLACESLHVCTVCLWPCEHARFCVEMFMRHVYIFTLIHTYRLRDLRSQLGQRQGERAEATYKP